jgi:hypothetical protein
MLDASLYCMLGDWRFSSNIISEASQLVVRLLFLLLPSKRGLNNPAEPAPGLVAPHARTSLGLNRSQSVRPSIYTSRVTPDRRM